MYIYGEITADMQSTALALFALREAQKNGYLPAAPTIVKGVDNEPVIEPDSSKDIIRRATRAIAKRQKNNGTFKQAIVWQRVHAFDEIGLPKLPMEEPEGIDEKSALTFLSTAQGYMALADALAMLDDPPAQYSRKLKTGANVLQKMTKALISGNTRGVKVGESPLAPYEYAFAVGRLLDTGAGNTAAGRRLWWNLTDFLINKRESLKKKNQKDKKENVPDTKVWVTRSRRVFSSPSIAALSEIRAVRKAKKWLEKHPKRAEKWKKPLKKKSRHFKRRWLRRRGILLHKTAPATAHAGLTLLHGARPPAVGVWRYDGKMPRVQTVTPVLARLQHENGVPLEYIKLPPALPPRLALEVPVLFTSGTGGFEPSAPEAYAANLKTFLTRDGILLAEGPAGAEGDAFFAPLKEKILSVVPESETVQVPAGKELPEIDGIRDGNGRMITAFVPVGKPEAEEALSQKQAMKFLYNLLKLRMDKQLLNADYALNWRVISEAEAKLESTDTSGQETLSP